MGAESLDHPPWDFPKDRVVKKYLNVTHSPPHGLHPFAVDSGIVQQVTPGHGSWQLVVLHTNSLFDDGFGYVVPLLETTLRADVHRNRDPTRHLSLVGPLTKSELLVLASQCSSAAKSTNLILAPARHAELCVKADTSLYDCLHIWQEFLPLQT